MKTKPLMKNTLFKINLTIVIFATLALLWWYRIILWIGVEEFFVDITTNTSILSLWIIYFTIIGFLPVTRLIGGKENEK